MRATPYRYPFKIWEVFMLRLLRAPNFIFAVFMGIFSFETVAIIMMVRCAFQAGYLNFRWIRRLRVQARKGMRHHAKYWGNEL
jgi:hypothetical protein